MQKNKTVSVIVPIYNPPKELLYECLESIRLQKYTNIEIILVNDGSTDDISEFIDNYVQTAGADDKRWKAVHQDNKGLSAARNTGYQLATGTYIQFLDADDYFDPNLVKKAVNRALTTGADVVIENFIVRDYDSNKERVILHKDIFPSKQLFSLSDISQSKIGTIPYNVWSKLFKKSFLDEHHLLHDEQLMRAEDVLFTYTALLMTDKITVSLSPDILYRENLPTSNSKTNDRHPAASVLAWRKLYDFMQKRGYYEYYRKDYELAMMDSLDWHYERLYTEEGRIALARASKDLFNHVSLNFYHNYRVIVELMLLDVEIASIYQDKICQIADLHVVIDKLEKKILSHESQIYNLERPGVKLAARKLLGAVRRKVST